MVIRTFADLLEYLKKQELIVLAKYGIVDHGPMIGKMYEGLTKKILSMCVVRDLDLHVVSGKIRGHEGKLSAQIDCMIVAGEVEHLPHTDDCICESHQVIAVVEVKKSLYSRDVADAYMNLSTVWNVHEAIRLDTRQLRDAYRTICRDELPWHNDVKKLPYGQQMIYHALVMDASLPIRIVLGYYGFKSEASLRKAFFSHLENNIGVGGYSPAHLPNLVICGQFSLLKTNGMPYGETLTSKGMWPVYSSSIHNPSLMLLNLLWSRMTYVYTDLSHDIFGEDLRAESFNPLIECTAISTSLGDGWVYSLSESTGSINLHSTWEPAILNEVCWLAVNWLCQNRRIELDDKEFLGFLASRGYDRAQFVAEMLSSRLVYLDTESTMMLLTDECRTLILPDGRLIAGDDKAGLLTKWVLRN